MAKQLSQAELTDVLSAARQAASYLTGGIAAATRYVCLEDGQVVVIRISVKDKKEWDALAKQAIEAGEKA